jgi:hypothetical protein
LRPGFIEIFSRATFSGRGIIVGQLHNLGAFG